MAAELRELFARAHCLRQLAEFGVDPQAPASRRAIDAIVASWDWDLRRVERCLERLVVAAAGARLGFGFGSLGLGLELGLGLGF